MRGELSGAGVPLSQVGRHLARIKFREVQGPLSRAVFPFPAGGWQSPALQKFPTYYPRA